jgi:hypothetical protein
VSKFRPVQGLRAAALTAVAPPWKRPSRSRGKKKKGRDYEKAAVRHFDRIHEGFFIPHPWMQVHDSWGVRWLQPDGLLIRPAEGIVTIVEFKLRHTPTAWFQLQELYRPAVEFLFSPPLWEVRLCEVVRWYDAATFFPGRVVLRPRLEDVKPDEVGVLIWLP